MREGNKYSEYTAAGTTWPVPYQTVCMRDGVEAITQAEIGRVNSEVITLLRLRGEPYTEDELEFIRDVEYNSALSLE